MESDTVCKLFHDYNFDDDLEFRSGFAKILNHVNRNGPLTSKNLLEAKLFYFSKKFNKITANDYSRWLKDTSGSEKDGTDSNLNMSKGRTDTSTDKCANTTGVDVCKETDDCKSDDSCSGISELCTENSELCTENSDLCTEISELCTEIEIKTVLSDREEGPSFGQVVEMISKGLPLPGVTDLGIMPLDIEPTTTRMERKAKPWEQG